MHLVCLGVFSLRRPPLSVVSCQLVAPQLGCLAELTHYAVGSSDLRPFDLFGPGPYNTYTRLQRIALYGKLSMTPKMDKLIRHSRLTLSQRMENMVY